MKRFVCLLLALICALALSSTAFAAGKLTVADDTMVVCESYEGYTAYIYAVLENTGDKPIEFNAGLIELLDENGDAIDAEDYLYCYPGIINPGEKGYLETHINVEEAESADFIDDYTLDVSGKSASENTNVMLDCTATPCMMPYSYTSTTEYPTIVITVTNNTEETVREIYTAFALYDEAGEVMYVDAYSPSYIGIPAGSSVDINVTVDSDVYEYWTANGMEPATVEAVAYSRQGY